MSFCACSPIMSNGICAKCWRHCSSTTPTWSLPGRSWPSPVVATEPSRNANGDPVHSFAGLMDHLGTMTRNTMRMPLAKKHRFTLLSQSTPLQEAAFRLLGFDPKRVQ